MTAATATLDERLEAFARADDVPGAAAGVVSGEDLIWSGATGRADLGVRRAPEPSTLFAIASISKTFTATAIVQLRDEGRLGLEDPLVRYVPEMSAATNPFGPIEMVTIRGLLRHTSGLQNEVPIGDDPRTETLMDREQLMASLHRVRVAIVPDSAFKYSNLGYRLLAEVVRRVSGQRLHDRLRSAVLEPLAMTGTTDRAEGGAGERATGYGTRDANGVFRRARAIDPSWCEGTATCGQASRTCRGGSRSSSAPGPRTSAARGRCSTGDRSPRCSGPRSSPTPGLGSAQALGWHVWRHGDGVLVGHTGSILGFSSHVCFDPEAQVGSVVLVNGVAETHVDLAADLVDGARTTARTHATPSRPEPSAARTHGPAPAAWADLTGTYGWGEFDLHATVDVREGRLTCELHVPYDVPNPLAPTDDADVFLGTAGSFTGELVRFVRGAGGHVEALNLGGWPMARIAPVSRCVASDPAAPSG